MHDIKAFLNGEFSLGEGWTIATGTDPIPDTPPQIKYHFDTDPLKIGTLTEDGLMDWKDRGKLPQVKEGDLLAEKIPGPKGKEGMDVYGKKIPIPKAAGATVQMRERRPAVRGRHAGSRHAYPASPNYPSAAKFRSCRPFTSKAIFPWKPDMWNLTDISKWPAPLKKDTG
jgi:hypothetical protein